MLIDIDEYLPEATLQWCKATLNYLGFPKGGISGEDFYSDGQRVHRVAYLSLREAVRTHMQAGAHPELGELKPPPRYSNHKRSRQYEQALRDQGVDIEGLEASGGVIADDNFVLAGEGPEEDAELDDIEVLEGIVFAN